MRERRLSGCRNSRRANVKTTEWPIALNLDFQFRRVYKEQKHLPETSIIRGGFGSDFNKKNLDGYLNARQSFNVLSLIA